MVFLLIFSINKTFFACLAAETGKLKELIIDMFEIFQLQDHHACSSPRLGTTLGTMSPMAVFELPELGVNYTLLQTHTRCADGQLKDPNTLSRIWLPHSRWNGPLHDVKTVAQLLTWF